MTLTLDESEVSELVERHFREAFQQEAVVRINRSTVTGEISVDVKVGEDEQDYSV